MPEKRKPLSPRVVSDSGQKGKTTEIIGVERRDLPLTRINFIIMGVAALLIVAGFLLMLGGGSTLEHFNPDIFSTRRVIVGPTVSFIGFVVMGIGIVYRPRKGQGQGHKEETAGSDD